MRRFIFYGRFIVFIPAALSFLIATVLVVYQSLSLMREVIEVFVNADLSQAAVKRFAVAAIEGVDVFLIAIALYITGLGLHALFVDEKAELPGWLKVNDLDDLKANLISVVIAVLAVLFLKEAVSMSGTGSILGFGIANGVVIAALTIFLRKKASSRS